MKPLTLLIAALAATTSALRSNSGKPSNAVLLSSIETLTLHSTRKTSSRRTSPVSQLSCVGGNARHLYSVDVMRCRNAGSEYSSEDIQWTCTANLPPEFKLGSTDVSCEGYDSPEDDYVLKGSCGVEYRLMLTDKGEEKYGRSEPSYSFGDRGKAVVFWIFFCCVAGFIIKGVWDNWQRGRAAGPTQFGGGGGGGGGWGGGNDDDTDPPPPYSPQGPPPKSYGTQPPSGRGAQQGWQPGPLAGAAAGAAAGYYFGNRGANQRQQQQGSSYDPQVGSSRSAERGFSNSPSSSPSPSSSRYESTGFGGTRRR